ncbi:MAG TPA: DUF6544 family protein [Gemmatimonadales bacterium]|nr:DUF6544 family protein [Gemmatimonadales bacterium]
MLNAALLILAILAATLVVANILGARRWSRVTTTLRQQIDAARITRPARQVDFRELADLPAPVQRYFRTALVDGQPIVGAARFQHSGSFNMGEATDRWASFTSDQLITTHRPGLDWNGRIRMAPGLSVRVHDAYVAGEGILHAAVLGLVSVADMRGTPELAAGELMRFLAEATWYPTALLPSEGVSWAPVDAHSAKATLQDGANTVTLRFVFDDAGLIGSVHATSRGRTVGGTTVPTPWQGRFWNYTERNGMRIPQDGEVAWLLPTGLKPYWRGQLTSISHDFLR